MVRDETKAAVMRELMAVARMAKMLEVDPLAAIEAKYPGTPVEVATEAWIAVDGEDIAAWWDKIEKTIDGEVVKSSLRLVGGEGA